MLDHTADIRAGIAFGLAGEVVEVLLGQGVTFLSKVNLEHRTTGNLVGERNVDTLLETSANGRVQLPWLRMSDC